MRVLHVISDIDPKAGGPAAAFAGLVSAQAAEGLDVRALATTAPGGDVSPADVMTRAGARVRLVESAGPRGLVGRLAGDGGPALAAAVAEAVADADVVHVHALWEPVQHAAALAARRRGVPYVFRPCGMLTGWSLRQKRLKKWAYLRLRLAGHLRRAAAVHFTTEQERRDSLALPTPAIVEPNGVDLAEFRDLPPRGRFRAAHPALGDRPVVAFLGRIFPGKGLEQLVPALGIAVAGGLDAALLVIGPDGGFRPAVERMVAEHKLGDRVVFAGLLKGADRVQALADADLFALPSEHENFGIAVVEAMAAGLPAVVSTEVGIHPDVTAAGAGSAVHRDPALIAAELTRWLGDLPACRAAGARARAFAAERYDWRQIAKRWAGHYERIVAGAAGR